MKSFNRCRQSCMSTWKQKPLTATEKNSTHQGRSSSMSLFKPSMMNTHSQLQKPHQSTVGTMWQQHSFICTPQQRNQWELKSLSAVLDVTNLGFAESEYSSRICFIWLALFWWTTSQNIDWLIDKASVFLWSHFYWEDKRQYWILYCKQWTGCSTVCHSFTIIMKHWKYFILKTNTKTHFVKFMTHIECHASLSSHTAVSTALIVHSHSSAKRTPRLIASPLPSNWGAPHMTCFQSFSRKGISYWLLITVLLCSFNFNLSLASILMPLH